MTGQDDEHSGLGRRAGDTTSDESVNQIRAMAKSQRGLALIVFLLVIGLVGLGLLLVRENNVANSRLDQQSKALSQEVAAGTLLRTDVNAQKNALGVANQHLKAAGKAPVPVPKSPVIPASPTSPTNGTQGIPGIPGLPGLSVAGPAGPPGASVIGPPGPAGVAGAMGLSVTGQSGSDGTPGAAGESVTGPQGDPGAPGADSVVPGPAGADGAAGKAGMDGANGAPGRGVVSVDCSSVTPETFTFTFSDGTSMTVTCTQPSPAPVLP